MSASKLQKKAALRVDRLMAGADEVPRMRDLFLGSEYKRFYTSPASQNAKLTKAKRLAEKTKKEPKGYAK